MYNRKNKAGVLWYRVHSVCSHRVVRSGVVLPTILNINLKKTTLKDIIHKICMGHSTKNVLLDKTFPINDFSFNVCNLIWDY